MKNYRAFEQMTIADLELLSQVHTRLIADGLIRIITFASFLDCVVARGEYANTSTDETIREILHES